MQKDYYAILQLTPQATDDDIRQAHRQLARQYHPDVNKDPSAAETFQAVQEAYEVLSDASQRTQHDQWRKQQGLDQPSALRLSVTASHEQLRPLNDEQAFYVLVNIQAARDLPTIRMPLNLAMVIDRSTSMRGTRLHHVKEAVRQIINKMQSDDALAVVAFSDRAEVLVPSQRQLDRAMARSVVSTIQANGGTELLPAIEAGLKELEKSRTPDSVNHLILLTDGQTYGDEGDSLQQAKNAGNRQISFSTIGIGTDWNEDLLDEMAAVSGGTSVYIDSPEIVKNIFHQTVRTLEGVVARDTHLTINQNASVRLHEVFQVAPYMRPLKMAGDMLKLGPLSEQQEMGFLFEFRVKAPAPGKQPLLRFHVEGDMPGHKQHRPWNVATINVDITPEASAQANIPAVLATTLGKLAIFKMQEKVMGDLENQKVGPATRRLELIATRLLNMGEAELAQAALLEAGRLARTGHLSAAGRKKIRYGTRALSGPLPRESTEEYPLPSEKPDVSFLKRNQDKGKHQ